MPSIVFGPIHSRRFGRSLGIDLSPQKKQCNFDCVYCELQGAKSVEKYSEILPLNDLVRATMQGLENHPNIDVLTISANGEPTLYPHLEAFIRAISLPNGVKSLILSNGSRFGEKSVQNALKCFDMVKFSLDSGLESSFKKIDRIHKNLSLEIIKNGIKSYAQIRQNTLICEVLLVSGINDNEESLAPLAEFLREIKVDRIDLGTIDRPPAYRANPVSAEKIANLANLFSGLCVSLPTRKNVPLGQDSRESPESKKSHESPQDSQDSRDSHESPESLNLNNDAIFALLKRRPLEVCEARKLLSKQSLEALENLISRGKIRKKQVGLIDFYTA